MICYHGTPITPNDVLIALKGSNFFVSFYRPDQIGLMPDLASSFAIDNGAFSAFTKGETIDFVAYKYFVEKWRVPNCTFHIIPDVIGGTDSDNAKMIESWGLPCGVPVWHLRDSLEFLADLVSGFDYIAIGGSIDGLEMGSSEWWGIINRAMGVICDDNGRPKVKIHGLGMLNNNLRSIPMHSADSTNIARNMSRDNMSRKTAALIMKDRIESIGSTTFYEYSGEQVNLFSDAL